MNIAERFRLKFQAKSNLYYEMTGEHATKCILGTDEFAEFHLIVEEYAYMLRATETDEKKYSCFGVDLFQGCEQNQMVFGR